MLACCVTAPIDNAVLGALTFTPSIVPQFQFRQPRISGNHMNEVYRDLILARVQAAIGAAKSVTGVKHKGLKGQLREIVIRDLPGV